MPLMLATNSMLSGFDIQTIIFSVLILCAGLFGLVWTIVFACFNGPAFKRFWKPALIWGLGLGVMTLAMAIFEASYFEYRMPNNG